MTDEQPKALLGLASTRELLEELQCRGKIQQHDDARSLTDGAHLQVDSGHLLGCLDAATLDYRTVTG
jgi:hypothetical protein